MHESAPPNEAFSVPPEALKVWPEEEKDRIGLFDVLSGVEYDIPGLEKNERVGLPACPTILDIGANAGAFTVWATERFPGCTIFAYEPNPTMFALLEQNAGPNVKARRCAVSNADGKTLLYLGRNNVGECSLVAGPQQDNSRAGTVKVVHARHLPEADIIKIDTEGSERVILENYPHLAGVKAVMLEYHSKEDREWIRSFLTAHGFSVLVDVERNYHGYGVMKFVRVKPRHLFAAVLSGGGKICVDHMACMQRAMQMLPAAGIQMTISNNGGTGVDRARNRSVAAFLETEATHFMFFDDDIVFDPQWVINMINSDFEVVAGAYPRKQMNWQMVADAVKAGVPVDELQEHAQDWIINYAVAADGTMGGCEIEGLGAFIEVEEAGTGFLLMKRSVVERMLAEYGPEMEYVTDYEPRGETHHTLFACQVDPASPREAARRKLLRLAAEYEVPVTGSVGKSFQVTDLCTAAMEYAVAAKDIKTAGRYLTEDYAFCRYWRMLKGKIHLYLDAKLHHIGPMTYMGAATHYFKRKT